VCDLENLKNEEAMTRVGSQRHSIKKTSFTSFSNLFYFGITLYMLEIHVVPDGKQIAVSV
jgi:hypothetical protein